MHYAVAVQMFTAHAIVHAYGAIDISTLKTACEKILTHF